MNNVVICKAISSMIESNRPNIFWSPCVVHALNLTLKNICVAKNISTNKVAYDECNWNTEVADDAFFH